MKTTSTLRGALCLATSLAAMAGGTSTLSAQTPREAEKPVFCRLEIYDVETGARTVLREFRQHIEAPNWTVDGSALIYNSGGRLYRIDVDAPGNEALIPAGETRANNDHVLSADGHSIAISASTPDLPGSRIFTMPVTGGEPRLITPESPSYLHGWSPDGSTLTYTARRGDDFDIYTIPAAGGTETRLTSGGGLDDGPEYSPDGRHIWFNSVRSGLMQLWRMRADGSRLTQITFDEGRNSWFPHLSPDGRRVLFLAYAKGDVEPGDHPFGRNVELRLMPTPRERARHTDDANGSGAKTIVRLFGGQGTINVNSWSPDSRRFAFVSYVPQGE